MTPQDPIRTAEDQAALAAGIAARKAAQAPVAPVEVVKESKEVQETAKDAAAMVAGAVTDAASLVSGNVTNVANDLKVADAERAEDKKRSDARQDKAEDRKHFLTIVSLIVTSIATVLTAAIAALGTYYGIKNASQIDDVRRTGIETHAAVNSAMRHVLYSQLVDKKIMAAEKPGDVERQRAVELAVEALAEHDRNQAKTDAKEKP